MANLTYTQQYQEAQAQCESLVGVVQPWLKAFTENYNKNHPGALGTCMYDNEQEDKVRIVISPFGNFFYNTEEGKKLMAQQKSGDIGLYYIYGASSAFVIEYSAPTPAVFSYQGQLYKGHQRNPVNAYFLYDEPYTHVMQRAKVPMDVAMAAKKLYSAQEHLGIVYACMREEQRRR